MFKAIIFYTNKLKLLKRFYQNVMELDIIESSDEELAVQVGDSTITFKHSEQPAFYHFAINIPGNQFSLVKSRMKDRLELNQEGGIDEIYFQNFDADAIYFEDPAGNIIELIGRRNQDLFGNVRKASFLNVSEVSITTPFVTDIGEQLQDFGIPLRQGTEVNSESLNFLGRDDFFLVLVPPARRWYFSEQESQTYPLEITLNDDRHISLNEEGQIKLCKETKKDESSQA